jgi:hypothetical protein
MSKIPALLRALTRRTTIIAGISLAATVVAPVGAASAQAASSAPPALNVYVSPTQGQDTGAGSASDPFKTLAQGRDLDLPGHFIASLWGPTPPSISAHWFARHADGSGGPV